MITDQPIGRAVLYVSSNVEPQALAAFSSWCDSIHHFDTMRIDGFLSLRRFELVQGTVAPGVEEFRLLTLYQVAKAGDADFSTPSYAQHTATYTPPPEGVIGHIEFDRTVFERVGDDGDTQRVGQACVSLMGEPGAWLDEALVVARAHPLVLQAHKVAQPGRAVVLADVETVDAGRAVVESLDALDHGGSRQLLQLFKQVFPKSGVLVRDQTVLAPHS